MHLFTLSFSRYQFNSTMWASLSGGIMGSISPAPFYVMQMNTSKQTDTQTDRQTAPTPLYILLWRYPPETPSPGLVSLCLYVGWVC